MTYEEKADEQSIYEEKGGKHRHGIPGKCSTTLWHPIGRKHRKANEEAPSNEY